MGNASRCNIGCCASRDKEDTGTFEGCQPDQDRRKENTIDQFNLTEEDVAEQQHLFSTYDKDGDGILSEEELSTVMHAWNKTDCEMKDFFNEVDVDGNGIIDFPDFLFWVARCKNREELVMKSFKSFDRDGDGFINAAEFAAEMALGENSTNEELREMMGAMDLDGDGKLSFDEFRKAMH